MSEGKNSDTVRIAVMTMVMGRDFPHASASIESIEEQLDETSHHFVLVNDDPATPIPLGTSPHRTVLAAGQNLGVAKGRNQLIRAALDWGADVLFSFDDDLLAPSDYLALMARQYAELSARQHAVGVFGPALIDYHASRNIIYRESDARLLDEGQTVAQRSTYELKRAISRRMPSVPADLAFHMGVANWELHYLKPYGLLARRLRARLEPLLAPALDGTLASYRQTIVKHRPSARDSIVKEAPGPIEVDTVPGGVACFSADLVREIGILDEAYSPFAFEDSEYSVRALSAGYRNYIVPAALLVHDVQGRLRSRQRPEVIAARGKMRALLLREHASIESFLPNLAEGIFLGTLDAFDRSRSGADRDVSGTDISSAVRYLACFIQGLFRPSHGPEPMLRRGSLIQLLNRSAQPDQQGSVNCTNDEVMISRSEIGAPSSPDPYYVDQLRFLLREDRDTKKARVEIDLIGGIRSTQRSAKSARLDMSLKLHTRGPGEGSEIDFSASVGGRIATRVAGSFVGLHPEDPPPETSSTSIAISRMVVEAWTSLPSENSRASKKAGQPEYEENLENESTSRAVAHLVGTVDGQRSAGLKWSAAPPSAVFIDELEGLEIAAAETRLQARLNEVSWIDTVGSQQRPEVLFAPHNGYHTSEMLSIAEEVKGRGYKIAFVDITDAYREEGVRARLEDSGVQVLSYSDDLIARLRPECVFVMNDWGGPPAKMVRLARSYPTVSVALVEGVQDYEDTHVEHIGVGRVRLPYTHSDVVLLVGEDDRRHLGSQETHVTGSSRIEKLALEPRNEEREAVAVINANFTYGVYSDAGPAWIRQAVEACQALGLDYVISQHHADRTELDSYQTSARTLYEELRRCRVFISRFSGAILEAMALGTPVVYFNPHHERVDKFQGNHHSFPIATDEGELLRALRDTLSRPISEIQELQKPFLAKHVSIEEGKSVPERVADVLENRVLRPASPYQSREVS